MFWHNFTYSLKVLLRNKVLIFWTFAFPIILGLLFNLAFRDIEKNEKFKVFDIAIVNDEAFLNDEVYKEVYSSLSTGDDRLFNITMTDKDNALKMLEDDEITGYLEFTDGVSITVNQSGIYETILRFAVDEIESNKELISSLIEYEISKSTSTKYDFNELISNIKDKVVDSSVDLNDESADNLSYTMIEYYTLIAMACLYGGTLSMVVTNYKLANMGSVGKRTAVSPSKKGVLITSSLSASYVVQLVELVILFLFTIFVLNVDYGEYLPHIVLLSLVGSLAGLSLGVAIATLVNSNENTKTGILIAVTMLGCFLSGMMGITMKYVVDTNVPIVNVINPASMITDGLYSLYYYGVSSRYLFAVISLIIFSIVLLLISFGGLRRQKYDSI